MFRKSGKLLLGNKNRYKLPQTKKVIFYFARSWSKIWPGLSLILLALLTETAWWLIPENGLVSLAKAVEPMESATYQIQLGNFNMTSGEKSGGGFKVTDTVGQTAAGDFRSDGYTILAGFQYIYTLAEFSFQISDLTIDLGELSSFAFADGTNDLTVTTASGGYLLLTRAAHPLQLKSDPGSFIPFTNCDGGCQPDTAGEWISPSNDGFGFNANGDNVTSDFDLGGPTYFRPFTNGATGGEPQLIASSSAVVKDDVTSITYRAAAAPSAAAGDYETVVEFWAIPSY